MRIRVEHEPVKEDTTERIQGQDRETQMEIQDACLTNFQLKFLKIFFNKKKLIGCSDWQQKGLIDGSRAVVI